MTSSAQKLSPRKRLLLVSLLTAALLAVAWIVYFLASFDLNDYRNQAEEELSALLSLPVTIGGIHYNLHDTNLALRLSDMQIGDSSSAIRVAAPSTIINLQWRGLLERKFKFTKISLVQPKLWVSKQTGAGTSQETAPPTAIKDALLHNISIKELDILGGIVHIATPAPGQPARQFDITNLDCELSNLGLNRTAQLIIKGDLGIPGQTENSPWQLQGESTLDLDEQSTLTPRFNLDLILKGLDLDAVSTLVTERNDLFTIAGTSDLHLHLKGSTTSDIDFQIELSSKKIALLPEQGYSKPILMQNVLANGSLQTHADAPGVSNLSLQIDESRMAGAINWTPPGQPFSATVAVINTNLSVPKLKQWLPDTQETWQKIHENLLSQGSIQIESAGFTLSADTAAQKSLRIDHAKGELQNIAWQPEKVPAVRIMSVPLSVTNDHWQIDKGRAKAGAITLEVNGSGERNSDGLSLKSLDFTGEALPSELLREWQIPESSLSTSGSVAFDGHVEGGRDQLSLDLQLNLSQFRISHPAGLTLAPGAEDKLTLHATLSPKRISLDHGALRWSVVKGHLSGSYLTEEPDSLAINALLTINDLSRLAEALPLLQKWRLNGQADLSINQKGWPQHNLPEMTLTLRDAGLHATEHIADLSRINGRVQVTPAGMEAKNLRVHLGQSPLTVQARLDDFAKPHLLLDVKAPSVRADDLIFSSDKALLRDIDGHLEIDRDGLSFSPVDVRLDGGTKANVRGTISFHAPYNVQLDINSEFARIDEVISLWANQSADSEQRSSPAIEETGSTESQATVKINARVKNGDLYGMRFHDASGVIMPSQKQLSIHPLDFSVGEGFCNAQVLTYFSPGAPTLLRVSGHAQDVDALEVYRELLNQKNVVRGKLRGDFHVVGEIGANYLSSSYGNFSIRVKDGVLHHFQILSKVFSLLNVSQIFALQLPDMDQEGMPFSNLSANLLLDKGILSSEDLQIESEAMDQSYSGQMNLINKELDLELAIHPLGTVDKIVSRIPLAGWLLTGDNRALLTAHFAVTGTADKVSVESMPLETLTEPTIGLLKRTIELPFKLIEDPQILWGGKSSKE